MDVRISAWCVQVHSSAFFLTGPASLPNHPRILCSGASQLFSHEDTLANDFCMVAENTCQRLFAKAHQTPPPPPPPRKYNKKAKKWKLRKKPLGHLMGLTISCHPVLLSPGPMPRGAAASARPCILLRAPVWGHPPVQRPFFWISKIALVYFYLFF